MQPSCPSCDGTRSRIVGPIPASDYFAGRRLERPLAGGRLFHCLECQLRFRYPRLSKTELDQLYEQAVEHAWTSTKDDRVEWQLADERISAQVPGGMVLDIGCFDGGFLASLPDRYEKYGIEIHRDAAEHAQKNGVRIVGGDFDALASWQGAFNAVTAFDVI